MIENLLRFSLRNRVVVALMGFLLIGLGVYNAIRLPIDAIPDITNRQVVINANAPALSAEEVERRITFPLEVALAGLPRLQETRSSSQFGLCQVQVVFDDSIDIYFARQLVNERLQEAREQLPPGVKLEVGPVSTGLGEIYQMRIENPKLSLRERRSLMDWTVKPQLRTVPGIAEVNTWGGEIRQVQVSVDPQKLQSVGLSMPDVVAALSSNNANAGGAYIRRGAEQQVVRTVGVLTTPDDIRRTVVSVKNGTPITVGQIATVGEGAQVRQGAITQDGKGEEVYAITMLLLGENGRIVVERVKDRVRVIEKTLPEGTRLIGFLDRSELIGRTLETATRNLVEGGLLVIAILFLFLLQLRAGLIVSAAIPLSMLIAIIGMKQFNVSANLMSLGAIDFGLIVDGAVIIVENCVRRLAEQREHLGRDLTEPEREETILQGTLEVRKATQFGELIIIATYLPILTLGDIPGKMFQPMGLTVIMALSGAMLLSFTVIPALCGFFLKAQKERRNPVLEGLTTQYQVALAGALRVRWLVVGAAVALLAVTGFLATRLGSEFIPRLDEGALAMQVIYPPSIALEETIKRSGQIEQLLKREFPDEIDSVVSRIGRSELATDPMPVSVSDGLISLHPQEKWKRVQNREELVEAMKHELEAVPGIGLNFSQPIELRMNELIEGVGIRSALGIKIFGNDGDTLARLAAQVQKSVQTVQGATEIEADKTQGLPQLQIILRRDALARYGVTVATVNAIVEVALGGVPVTQIVDNTQRVDVTVRLPENLRDTPGKIAQLRVPLPNGSLVPLSVLADIKSTVGPVQISRENGQRRIVVQGNVVGRDLGGFVADVQKAVARDVTLPQGYRIEYGGTFEQLKEANARLVVVVPLTFVLVFFLLFLTFGNVRQSLLVFTGVPFAIIGGVFALLLRGMPLSTSASIGFIALAGVAVLNGVVMVMFINQLRAAGRTLHEAILEGARDRLRPVLMTACVASFGFIPMALGHGAGAEVQRPLATVVIGGLFTSTLLTLFVLPLLYEWLEAQR